MSEDISKKSSEGEQPLDPRVEKTIQGLKKGAEEWFAQRRASVGGGKKEDQPGSDKKGKQEASPSYGYSMARVNKEKDEAWESFDRGEISAEELEKKLNGLLDKTKDLIDQGGERFKDAKADAARVVLGAKKRKAKEPDFGAQSIIAGMEGGGEPAKKEEAESVFSGAEKESNQADTITDMAAETTAGEIEVPKKSKVEDITKGGESKEQGVVIEKIREAAEQAFRQKFGERSDYIAARARAVFEAKCAKKREEWQKIAVKQGILSAKQMERLFIVGESLEDILSVRRIHWWSDKFKCNLLPGREFFEEELDMEIDKLIKEGEFHIMAEAEEEMGKDWDKMHKEAIPKIIGRALAEQSRLIQEAKKKRQDELRRQARIERAKNIPDEERSSLLEDMGKKWEEIKTINAALRQNRRIKLHDGRVLYPTGEEADAAAEELEELKIKLFNEVINIANKLAGRKLRREASSQTGYAPDEGDDEKRKKFQEFLAEKVREIYKEQAEMVKKSFGLSQKSKRWAKIAGDFSLEDVKKSAIVSEPTEKEKNKKYSRKTPGFIGRVESPSEKRIKRKAKPIIKRPENF